MRDIFAIGNKVAAVARSVCTIEQAEVALRYITLAQRRVITLAKAAPDDATLCQISFELHITTLTQRWLQPVRDGVCMDFEE